MDPSSAPQDDLPSTGRDPASTGSGGSSIGDEPTRVTSGGEPASDSGVVLPLGPSIEGYLLKEEIHRGGQGVVYRAVQLGTKRQVALKVLLEGPFAGETTRRRFEREIEVAASLRHPNIVSILESGTSQGCYYFAMEYVDGLRLDRHVAQRRLALDAALHLFEKVCLAVNFAHQRGVIHRDLKPPNILVDNEGEPHILDFGLAKPMHHVSPDASTVQQLSLSGQLLGTVAYMSPEQAAGQQDVDVRSDVYSLGVVFYDALAGQPPYPVDGPLGDVLRRIAQDDPANPRSLASPAGFKIDDETATILLKALEKEPQRRYQTAGELAHDLRRRLNGEPLEAKRASGLYMLKKTLRRYRLQAATAGLILAMLVGFLIAFAVLFTKERDARQRADTSMAEAEQAAVKREAALQEARQRTSEALTAQQKLRRALLREHIQRGDLALQRGELVEARDSYWDARDIAAGPAATWALRRYHLQTAQAAGTLLALEGAWLSRPEDVHAVLSPGGELAAVRGGPTAIWLRQTETGQVLGGVRAPATVMALDVRDDGALAATGSGWAAAWPASALRPAVFVQFGDPVRPRAVYAADAGNTLLLVGPQSVRVARGATGEQGEVSRLRGTPVGLPAYTARGQRLAVPTSAGIELLMLTAEGIQHEVLAPPGDQPPRAVQLDGDTLTVLSDALYAATLAGAPPAEWRRLATDTDKWRLFHVEPRTGRIAFAERDGRLGILRDGTEQATWRLATDDFVAVQAAAGDDELIALDERGTLTRWIAPRRVVERRSVFPSAPTAWAASADGSCILLVGQRGRVSAYQPDVSPTPRLILRPRLLGMLGERGEERAALGVSADGRRAVVREGGTLRFFAFDERTQVTWNWDQPRLIVPERVALNDDGKLVTVLARNAAGNQQQVAFLDWPSAAKSTRQGTLPPFDFVGAVIRDMAFLPGSRKLLVARSNGQLLLLNPDDAQRPPPIAPLGRQPAMLTAWLQLDAPAAELAFSRSGQYLAVACDDNTVRLISPARREVLQRIRFVHTVTCLSFNPQDDVLMVRTSDGFVRLYDPATGENLAEWPAPGGGERPLALWLGQGDALLLGEADGVYEHRYDAADALIEKCQPYARQRQVARLVASGDLPGAWAATQTLMETDAVIGGAVRLKLLELVARRPGDEVPPEWIRAALAPDEPPGALLLLGHAAYDGAHYALAQQWLGQAAALAAGQSAWSFEDPAQGQTVDALTLRRLAECAYLSEDYRAADTGLAAVLARPDADASGTPTLALERVATLVMADRIAEARQAALRIGEADPWGRYSDMVAVASARIIARVMSGLEDEALVSSALDDLLTRFAERSLLYYDDAAFFAGELARRRGDAAQAAVQYQRCIDLSRDPWPASWARYRLAQLAKAAP